MNIAKTGPAGYEHQYRTSVLVGLLLADVRSQLFIESVGEEDATLKHWQNGRDSIVEIQIKSSSRDIDIAEVAEMLATFPKGKSKGCLLERLLADSSRIVFLICGGRCKDSLSGLLVLLRNLQFQPRNNDPLIKKSANRLLEQLKQVYTGGKQTDLRKTRHATCVKLVTDTSAKKFTTIARRIFLVEQITTEHILEEIRRVLVDKHRVPGATANSLADAPLRSLVEQARDTGADLMPSLREEIRRHQIQFVGPLQPYLIQPYEGELYAQLKHERALLLTGLPLCGKTQLALSLAGRSQREGFQAIKAKRLEEASRFLLAEAAESRLALIEDPFGKVRISQDGSEDWTRLAELLQDLKPHCRLIVTNRSDVLAELRKSVDVAKWVTEGFSWIDLAKKASSTLVQDVWESWASNKGRNATEISVVRARLCGKAFESLQPGHASFLAQNRQHDYRDLGDSQIIALARKDATELSRELCSSVSGKLVLRGLGAVATTLDGPDETTLAFILGNESESWPGLRSMDSQVENTSSPRMNRETALCPEWTEILNVFENRGVIEWNREHCKFTHPLWEESGVQALLGTGHFEVKEVRRIIENALFCSEPTCSFNAVGALTRISLGLSVDRIFSPEKVELMLKAAQSIFPRVMDLAVAFLLENLDALPQNSKVEAVRIAKGGIYSARELSWDDGVARFFRGSGLCNLMERRQEDAERKCRTEALCKKVRVSELSADQLLDFYEFMGSYNASNVAHLERGIAVEEAIVRAEAYHLIALHHWKSRPELVRRGLFDPHPRVVVRTMWGLALVWPSVQPEQRSEWLQGLTKRLRRVGFGFVALQTLLNFRQWAGWNQEWYEGRTASWELWCECMIAALSTDPGYFGLHEAGLYNLVEQAMNEVPMNMAVGLCSAWLGWTERRLSYAIPSDYGGSVAELLFVATGSNAFARGKILSRMVGQKDTAFQVLLLRDLCRFWDSMSTQEQDEVMNCLRSDRSDVRWLKAVILVDGKAPSVLLRVLADDADLRELSPEEIVERLSEQLLSDALHVFCGCPQPLWYIGTHHINGEIWRPVLLHIARIPTHELFDFAIQELLRRDDEEWRGLSVWEELCRTGEEATVNRLFVALLKETMVNTGAPLAEHWWLIVRSPGASSLKANWGSKVADEIETIGYAKNSEIVLSQLHEALEHLPGEKLFNALLSFAAEFKDDEARKSISAFAGVILKTEPPREQEMLYILISLVENETGERREPPFVDPILQAARTRRRNAINKGAARQVRALSEENAMLPGWYYPRASSDGVKA